VKLCHIRAADNSLVHTCRALKNRLIKTKGLHEDNLAGTEYVSFWYVRAHIVVQNSETNERCVKKDIY